MDILNSTSYFIIKNVKKNSSLFGVVAGYVLAYLVQKYTGIRRTEFDGKQKVVEILNKVSFIAS